jgi:hypothetical protein
MMTADLGTTGIAMRSLSGRLVRFAFTAGIVSLFASEIAAARNLAAPYLGMTEAQIIACAGEPHSRFKSGAETKTLTYHYSGAGPVPAEKSKDEEKKSEEMEPKSIFSKLKEKEDKNWTCSASLFFQNNKLVRVTFAHKDVRSPYQWQHEKNPEKAEKMRREGVPTCTFSLPRCAPAQ